MRQSRKRRSECSYDWALDTPKMTPSFHLAHVSIPLILQFAEISDHHYSSPDTALKYFLSQFSAINFPFSIAFTSLHKL